jgi:hypothetical protein
MQQFTLVKIRGWAIEGGRRFAQGGEGGSICALVLKYSKTPVGNHILSFVENNVKPLIN